MLFASHLFSKRNIVFFVVVLLLSLTTVFFTLHTFRSLTYPYNLNYTEGHVLTFSIFLNKLGNYFFNINDYPYIHAIYPPIFPYIVSLFIPVFGEEFIIGRVISLFATFLVTIILYSIFFKISKDKVFSLIVSLIFFIPRHIIEFSTLNRVDMLAVFFSIAGFIWYVLWYEKKSPYRYVSIIFFILAFYTKQSSLAAPLSLIVYLLVRNRRECVAFTASYLAPLAGIFFIINLKTSGQFYLHLVKYTKTIAFNTAWIFEPMQFFVQGLAVFVVLIIVNMLVMKKYTVYTLYFLVNIFFLLGFSKAGSGINYYIEPFLSTVLLGGLIFLHLLKTYPYFFTLLLSGIMLQIFLLMPFTTYGNIVKYPFFPHQHASMNVINFYIKNFSTSYVLSEDLGFLTVHKKPLLYEAYGGSWLTFFGALKNQKLVHDCEKRKFSLIIAGDDILSVHGLQKCISKEYDKIDALQGFYGEKDYLYIYIPKTSNSLPEANSQ